MGCYDDVTFRCPTCRQRITAHSKAGVCDLLSFDSARVPLSIAGDLEGSPLWCRACQCQWTIRTDAEDSVPMKLVDESVEPSD